MIVVVGGGAAGEDPAVEYDPYTPVTVTWPGYRRSLEPPVTLGLNGPGGFLELKFGRSDRRLTELVLVYGVVSVRDTPLPVAASPGGSPAAVELAANGSRHRALSGDLPLPQIAYLDALEIRISDRPPATVALGPRIGFGARESGELTSIYLRYTAGQRADLIAGCRRPAVQGISEA